jgi:TM2 domain-containing membrane protein YozV
MNTTTTTTTYKTSDKSLVVAYLLWFFLGMVGAHRFYTGRTGSAIGQIVLYWGGLLATMTFIGALIGIPMMIAFGIWWIVDAFLMMNWGLQKEVLVKEVTQTTEPKQ